VESAQFTIRGLTKRYNGNKVLDISDLVINKGKICGVMGPNGSGKTTLLSILALLVKPTSGRIIFDGLEINGRENDEFTLRREMTMVFQNPFLFNTTVEKNVAYGLRIRRLSKKEQRRKVSECLDLVGLTGFQKRKANELSSGEIQRVAIARGIAVNPKVLFLDEPTANVDKTNIDILEKIVKQWNCRYKATIIFATHDLNQACRLADKVIALSEGKIKEILDP
jgi:tungstate transport system ATP-binding protein